MPNAKRYIIAVYVLQFIGAFTHVIGVVLKIAGVVIDYNIRKMVEDKCLQTHITWQIKTFWYGISAQLLIYVAITIYMASGLMDKTVNMLTHHWIVYVSLGVLAFLPWVWFIYRSVKGFVFLRLQKTMY